MTAQTNFPWSDTHPWITFQYPITDLNYKDLIWLGEAASKLDHIAGLPLPPATAQELNKVYLTKGVHGTTSIEGNTLEEEQVRQKIDGELKLPPSQAYRETEVENMMRVFNQLVDECTLEGRPKPLTVERICEFNREVLRDLKLEDDDPAGTLRTRGVVVPVATGGNYRGADARYLPEMMDRFVDFINTFEHPEERLKVPFAIVRAILAHLYFVWIHPFPDGNGRTARLIEYQLLIEAGAPIASAHVPSDFYNNTRDRYYHWLHKTSVPDTGMTPGPAPFLSYAIAGFVDGLREQVHKIQRQQLGNTWINYVHDRFRDANDSKTTSRRRQLAISMGTGRPYTKKEILELDYDIVRAYANATPRTLSRDLSELMKLNLVAQHGKQYRAKIETLLAFLPVRHQDYW